MEPNQAQLHLICGKIASGKSTLAQQLASAPRTILLSEDEWLSKLYPNEIKTLEDYIRCTQRLRAVMGDHIVQLLKTGLSVVLDFQANTVKTREWMKSLIDQAQVGHQLHYLDVPNEVCKERLKKRNESGDHPYQTSETQFDVITSYFAEPKAEEGFRIVLHRQD